MTIAEARCSAKHLEGHPAVLELLRVTTKGEQRQKVIAEPRCKGATGNTAEILSMNWSGVKQRVDGFEILYKHVN